MAGKDDGRRRGRDEETGWIDDLRTARDTDDDLGGADFTSGGSSRWARLRALSDEAAGAERRHSSPDEPEPRRRAPRDEPDPGPRRRDPAMTERPSSLQDSNADLRRRIAQENETRRGEDTAGGRRRPDMPPPAAEPGGRRSPVDGGRGGPSLPRRHQPGPGGEPGPVSPGMPRNPGMAAPGPASFGAPPGPGGARGGVPGGMPAGGRPSGEQAQVRPRPNTPRDGRARAGLHAGVEAIRGARSEVRRQLREQQRLRMWTLIVVVIAVVGALPFYFVLRAATRDPVIASLDGLSVPSWAFVTSTTKDNISGSRWCLGTTGCRYRERTTESRRPIDETETAYKKALSDSGWVAITDQIPNCGPDLKNYSCWRRDEFTLDLWVRDSECARDPLRLRPTVAPSTPADGATPDPSASAAPPPAAPDDGCNPSQVTIKVFNAIADERLRGTADNNTNPDPGELTNEDLHPSLTPLATPSAP